MFETISWSQYFSATSLVLVTYYAVTTLFLYHQEIIYRYRKPFNSPQDIPPILGPVHPEPAPTATLTTAADLTFQQASSQEESPEPAADSLLIGPLPDLIQQLKSLAAVSGNSPAIKVFPLVQHLLAQYPALASSSLRDAITLYIYTTLREINLNTDLPTIDAWWPSEQNQSQKS